MTYNAGTPNANASPGVFPTQANTNFTRLKTIINAEHVFNDTTQADDGVHKQVSLVTRATPGSLTSGTNGMAYVTQINGVGQLFFYNGSTDEQISDGYLKSTALTVSASYGNVAAIPINMYGEISMYKGTTIQRGCFVSDNTTVRGYSYAEKWQTGSAPTEILRLANDTGTAGIMLRVANFTGDSSYNGTWSYQIKYRPR